MTRAAIYARVSTSKQDTANQVHELEEFATRRGYEVTHRFVETQPGWEPDREKLKQLYSFAYRREFDLVLVWALDRFSRQGISATLGLVQRLRELGIPLVSLREEFLATTDPRLAELLEAVFAWIARQEHLRISDRTKAGIKRKRAAGGLHGRPTRYRISAAAAERAVELRAAGKSWSAVLAALGLPDGALSSLRRIVERARRPGIHHPPTE